MPGADLVEQAVQAIQSGEHERAQGLLAEQLAEHPQDDRAWFWLSASVSDPDKKRYCLERALSIQPTNEQAAGLWACWTAARPLHRRQSTWRRLHPPPRPHRPRTSRWPSHSPSRQ